MSASKRPDHWSWMKFGIEFIAVFLSLFWAVEALASPGKTPTVKKKANRIPNSIFLISPPPGWLTSDQLGFINPAVTVTPDPLIHLGPIRVGTVQEGDSPYSHAVFMRGDQGLP